MDGPADDVLAKNDLVGTWRRIVQDPVGFYATMPETGGLGEPMRFLSICAAINAAGSFLLSFSIAYAIWAFVMLIVGMVLVAVVMTLVTQHLLEGHAGFEPVFRAVAYGAAPSVAFWLPIIGPIAALYACFLHVRGIERVQNLDAVRAILATAIAWVATLLVVGFGSFPVAWFGR
jgi:hypothetical protein